MAFLGSRTAAASRRPVQRQHRWWLLAAWGFGAAGLCALAAMAGSASSAPRGAMPETAVVQRDTLEATVIASGVLQAEEMVSLGTQVTGQLKRLHVRLGDAVAAGQRIAEIDAAAQSTAVEMAQYQLAAALAQQRVSEVEEQKNAVLLQRQRELMAGQGTSREALEAAESAHAASRAMLEAAVARVQEARGTLKTAQLSLGHTSIRSPIDGEVVAVLAREGQMINANFAAPTLVKVARLATMRIRASVSELDIGRVRLGQAVSFATMGAPGEWREATLRVVEPLPAALQNDAPGGTAGGEGAGGAGADAPMAAVYFGVMLEADNRRRDLRVGMTVLVRIVVDRAEDALVVPLEAVDTTVDRGTAAGTVQVWRADGGTELRSVRLGLRDKTRTQVLAGLRQGERVVLRRPAGA